MHFPQLNPIDCSQCANVPYTLAALSQDFTLASFMSCHLSIFEV